MAYTDWGGKTILSAGSKFKIAIGAACLAGDLVARDGTLADANANKPAKWVALEEGASADIVEVAEWAVVKKQTTVGTSGATTRGDHSGTADDVLWLSATAGKASATPVATIGQMVGVVLSQDEAYLKPAEKYDDNVELVAANKTLDEQDTGKQMYVTADAIVVTLPAVATGVTLTVVNGMNDGGALVSVDPNANDGIGGPDRALSTAGNGKKALNTKATARAGDRITVEYGDADGWFATELVGTWAWEA